MVWWVGMELEKQHWLQCSLGTFYNYLYACWYDPLGMVFLTLGRLWLFRDALKLIDSTTYIKKIPCTKWSQGHVTVFLSINLY